MQPASSHGFTLIEVVVALAILVTVLVSLPTVLTQAERATASARQSVVAGVAAAEKLEQLRGLALGFDAAGARVEDLSSDASQSPVTPEGGGGLALSPGDSLDSDVPGFADYLDADGRWLAAAGAGAAGAALIRRWSVTELAGGPGDTLVLCVRVLAFPVGAGATRARELVRLSTTKSRRAR